MRRHVIGFYFLCSALLLLPRINDMALSEALERKLSDKVYIQETATSNEEGKELDSLQYVVSWVNLQDKYENKDFSNAPLQKKEMIPGKELGEPVFGDYECYWFKDGTDLVLPGAFSLQYGGHAMENLDQINTYVRYQQIKKSQDELPFMTRDQAIECCKKKLENLGLEHLEYQTMFSFSVNDIEHMTNTMLERYGKDDKLAFFKTVTDENAAYEVVFRNKYGERWTINTPEAIFYVHGDGTISFKLSCLRDEVIESRKIQINYSLEAALNQFVSYHEKSGSLQEVLVITDVTYGYGFDQSQSDYANNRMLMTPYWIIQYNKLISLPEIDLWDYNLQAEINAQTGAVSGEFIPIQ